ncbi:MAG: response regulator [Deltaproteobacteria bacterium]|nr:MAG: response regulator [Deltaproteobacteria bacterium]TMQ07967.1 MAG: response regulator [Deltaproteobacteria bacterium]
MSQRREALIARYRTISLERLRSIRGKLEAVAEGNTEALADVRRELHTLKGDSHLLGMVQIGKVAHACEERLLDQRTLGSAVGALGEALEAIKLALHDDGDERAAEEELGRALVVLSAPAPEIAEAPPAAPSAAPAAEPAAEPFEEPTPEQLARLRPVKPGARKASERREASRWVHVSAHDVDVLCERLSALHADLGRIHAALRGMLAQARDTMHDVERLRSDLDEIVSSAWALRLSPVHPTLAELGEHALELARTHGKQLRVRIDDGGALVERRLLDEVHEPLLHLIRNAVDHGIEPAHERGDKPVPAELLLAAVGHRDQVVITVADDGRGIDFARVHAVAAARGLADPSGRLTEEAAYELLFLQGFSTRQDATDLSGRGVGLDAVRRRLTSIGGRVSVSSTPGAGTRFAIHIPSTVFRERVLIADVGGALCALPAREVEAIVPIESTMLESVGSTPLLRYQGEGIPFLPLPLFRGDADSTRAAIVSHGGHRWAISLPDVIGDVELLRVPVDAAVASLGPFAASGTLDDGRLVLVVSLDALLSHPRQVTHFARAPVRDRGRRRVLVVDDSPIVRDLLQELLSSVGLEVRVAGDGAAALQSLTENPVDLIVCDVEMPVMDGFELLRRLRDRADHVPVVMVTTRGTVSDRAMAASLGADALIVKSEFENAHLLETVRRFVEITA